MQRWRHRRKPSFSKWARLVGALAVTLGTESLNPLLGIGLLWADSESARKAAPNAPIGSFEDLF
eukprot:12375625-Alexandrium_andersonii.AAC.1